MNSLHELAERAQALRHRLRRMRQQLIVFFAVVGPGIITANVDNDAGGIYTYSLAGAQYGYTLLWSLVPMTFALVVAQEMSARMGVVTGKGLSDLIREEFGFRITFLVMMAVLAVNLGNIFAEFAGIASSLEIFGVSKYISVPLGALLVWLLVVKGTYRFVEKIFLIACVFYISYVFSAILAKPDWWVAAANTVRPHIPAERGYLIMLIGLVGTTVAPWQQFYLQAAVVEKNVPLRRYKEARWDAVIGALVSMVVVFFIIVACAATLHVSGHRHILDAAEAAIALKPLAGEWASGLFAFGLLNASLFAASVLPLSTAYVICEGLGVEAGLDKRFREAPFFYWLYTALLAVGAGIILLPGAPLVRIAVLSQVVNGFLLPVVLIFMLLLVNRRDLMGEYRNTRSFNIIAWSTSVVMIALTLMLIYLTVWRGEMEALAQLR